jgi:hypothetical protein
VHSVQVVLNDARGNATVPAMPKDKDKEKEPQEPGIWHFREIPREVIVKAKIGAALEGLSVKAYMIKLVEAHWQEMEKEGILPKGKG